jgi:uncharacterized membrane protein YkvA (DUF1232 family)
VKSKEFNKPGTERERSDINIDELFKHKEWQHQADDPGVLESIGRQLDTSLATDRTGFKDYLDDLKLAYEMLKAPDFTIEKSAKIMLIIALLYIVSPIDLIPDSIPFLGVLDDVLVAGYVIKQMAPELERYRKFKQH